MEGACVPLALVAVLARGVVLRADAFFRLASADYGFEYSDDEPEEEDVDIENQYYNAKGAQLASQSAPSAPRRASPAPQVWRFCARTQHSARARVSSRALRCLLCGCAARCAGRGSLVPPCLTCCSAGLLESDDPKDALDAFASVIQMEKEKGEWCVSVAPPPLRARFLLPRFLSATAAGAAG